MKLTDKMRAAMELVISVNGPHGAISCDDERIDEFADDGDPDTWNTLFDAGYAEQSGPGFSGDDFSIRLTDAGRALLRAEGETP